MIHTFNSSHTNYTNGTPRGTFLSAEVKSAVPGSCPSAQPGSGTVCEVIVVPRVCCAQRSGTSTSCETVSSCDPGFWTILVLSAVVGCICCVFSWTLTYLDSYQPGMAFPTLLTLPHFRDVYDHGFHMGYGVAVLNGIMAMLTAIWSLC
uniref:ADP-ribosylation factor-like 6 interacting protein 6 n=1 Tax=Amphilophus citrinellus TaxID=61819 RepID=A0A3Q0R0G0_AMPCI